jgi:hypothetical protein
VTAEQDITEATRRMLDAQQALKDAAAKLAAETKQGGAVANPQQ